MIFSAGLIARVYAASFSLIFGWTYLVAGLIGRFTINCEPTMQAFALFPASVFLIAGWLLIKDIAS